MKGTILQYDKNTHKGFISGHDGNRYTFTKIDWASDKAPKEGMTVDFEANGKEAKDIVQLKTEADESKEKPILPLVTLFLGVIALAGAFMIAGEDVTTDDVYVPVSWAIIAGIVGIVSIFKGQKRRGWTITGLVIAAVSAISAYGMIV